MTQQYSIAGGYNDFMDTYESRSKAAEAVLVPWKVFSRIPDVIHPAFRRTPRGLLDYKEEDVNVMFAAQNIKKSSVGTFNEFHQTWLLEVTTLDDLKNIKSRMSLLPTIIGVTLDVASLFPESMEVPMLIFLNPKALAANEELDHGFSMAEEALRIGKKFSIEFDFSGMIEDWALNVLGREFTCFGGKVCLTNGDMFNHIYDWQFFVGCLWALPCCMVANPIYRLRRKMKYVDNSLRLQSSVPIVWGGVDCQAKEQMLALQRLVIMCLQRKKSNASSKAKAIDCTATGGLGVKSLKIESNVGSVTPTPKECNVSEETIDGLSSVIIDKKTDNTESTKETTGSEVSDIKKENAIPDAENPETSTEDYSNADDTNSETPDEENEGHNDEGENMVAIQGNAENENDGNSKTTTKGSSKQNNSDLNENQTPKAKHGRVISDKRKKVSPTIKDNKNTGTSKNIKMSGKVDVKGDKNKKDTKAPDDLHDLENEIASQETEYGEEVNKIFVSSVDAAENLDDLLTTRTIRFVMPNSESQIESRPNCPELIKFIATPSRNRAVPKTIIGKSNDIKIKGGNNQKVNMWNTTVSHA